jgi:hypothetical protein
MTGTNETTNERTETMTTRQHLPGLEPRVYVTDFGTCLELRTANRFAVITANSEGRLRVAAGSTGLPGHDFTFGLPRHDRDDDQALGLMAVELKAGLTGRDLRRVGLAPEFARVVARLRRQAAA